MSSAVDATIGQYSDMPHWDWLKCSPIEYCHAKSSFVSGAAVAASNCSVGEWITGATRQRMERPDANAGTLGDPEQICGLGLRARRPFSMSTVLDLKTLQTMAQVLRETYLSHMFLLVLLVVMLKYVVASWRYGLLSMLSPSVRWTNANGALGPMSRPLRCRCVRQ